MISFTNSWVDYQTHDFFTSLLPLSAGATPQRREILYPQNLTRTGRHEELLDEFGFQPPPIKANLMRSLELAAQEEETEDGVSVQVYGVSIMLCWFSLCL